MFIPGPGFFDKNSSEMMEKEFVDGMIRILPDPDFLSRVGKGISASLDAKKTRDSFINAFLRSRNLPSKEDTALIMQYLQQIESKIMDLEEKVERAGDEIISGDSFGDH